MNRAHAYKAAVEENRLHQRDPDAGVNMGLYNYPALMAADILFPAADIVPVGLDQKQHIEITQDIAQAFNAMYGSMLKIPQPLIDERVMTIAGTDGRKMSKSYGNVIPILHSPEALRKSVMRIKTDSRRPEEPKNPETDVIFQLFEHVAPPSAVASISERYRRGGLGYAAAKGELLEALDAMFRLPRERYQQIAADRDGIDRILREGAERARASGAPVLERVRQAVGMGRSRLTTNEFSPYGGD
jgi:tryptophanyl-tRNA synthetase